MLNYYKEKLSIKTKLQIAFGLQVLLIISSYVSFYSALEGYITQSTSSIIGSLSIVISVLFAFCFYRAIAYPYATTVIRMERLADGDLNSPIAFTNHTDCVGRMTKAMHKFKESAIAKQAYEAAAQTAEQKFEALHSEIEAERAENARRGKEIIGSLASGLRRLAEGDVNQRIDGNFGVLGEPARLDFNASVEKLRETLITIGTASQSIRSGTSEITSATDDLARRTEQQAASLEETAAALEEITSTVKKTSEGATYARQVVSQAKMDADESGDIVNQAITAMSGIEKSSQQIGQIIGVIDEIAFQTNLLALNAGVEAARAGDAGRGFAVVASEVRALAQRSAEAAKEIKGLISTSSAQVGQGVSLVGETGKALSRIVSEVDEINGIVSEIAVQAQEHSSGLHQVNIAVNQMDQVTQQNAAMVEETTAAAHALNQQGEELTRLIACFQTGQKIATNPALTAKARKTQNLSLAHTSSRPMPVAHPIPKPNAAASLRNDTSLQRKAVARPNEDNWEEF